MILLHLVSYHIHIKLEAAGSPGVCFSLIMRHNVSADQLNWNLTPCWKDINTLAKGNTETSVLLCFQSLVWLRCTRCSFWYSADIYPILVSTCVLGAETTKARFVSLNKILINLKFLIYIVKKGKTISFSGLRISSLLIVT